MGHDPRQERLIEDRRARRSRAMLGRERLSRWGAALSFAGAAAALAASAPSGGRAISAVSVVLVLLYAFASRIEFEIGSGSALATQLVVVPMLFVFPAALVPAAVALGLLLGGALGNLLDRVRYGSVIDFVDMGIGAWRFYTYNVADAAISTAIVLLVAMALFPAIGDWAPDG